MALQLVELNVRNADVRLPENLGRETDHMRTGINIKANLRKIDRLIFVSACNQFEGHVGTVNYSEAAESFAGYAVKTTVRAKELVQAGQIGAGQVEDYERAFQVLFRLEQER